MTTWTLIPLITCISSILVFILVLQYTERRISRYFAYFLGAAAIWSFISFTLRLNAFPEQALFWNQLLVIAFFWTIITYYHFIRTYAGQPRGNGILIGYALLAVLTILSLNGYIVQDAYVIDGGLHSDLGISGYLITAVGLAYFGSIVYQLLTRYLSSADLIERNRTMYLIAGCGILVALTYVTLIPPLAGLPIDHIGSLINIMVVAYAISQFHLLDTKLVVRRGLAYFISIAALIGLYLGVLIAGFKFFPEQPVSSVLLGATIVTLLLALMASPVRFVIEEGIDRIFYRGTYDHRQALLSFGVKMSNILNLEQLAQAMLPEITKALNITYTGLLFQENPDADFIVHFTYPEEQKELLDSLKFGADNPIIGWLDKKGEPLNPARIDSIAELKGLWQVEKEQVINSTLEFLHPLKSRGKLIGILALGKKQAGRPYSHGDLVLVSNIANQAAIIIENAHLYAIATTKANTDDLTGLFNHRHFHQRLDQEIARATRFGSTFSLIMLDLDLFKSYNDTYGHLAGDQILRRVSQAIENSIRTVDTAFRYGGEEYTVILPETSIDDAYQVAERIRKTVESTASFRETPVTCSLGIANWPSDGIMKEEVVGRADAAMYQAKESGRNRTALSKELKKPVVPLVGAMREEEPKALSIVYALAATVDAKDHYTYGHSRKVSEHAVALAEAMNLAKDRIDIIRTAGLLHDIGKISVPDSVLTKPETLNDKEWAMIKTHPERGVEILKRIVNLANCLPAILYHHENYDGSGYPTGLKGDSIPLEARILAVADTYDAITSPRSYRSQLTSEQAVKELKRGAGSQLDPKLAEIFSQLITQPPPGEGLRPEVESASDSQH